MRPVQEPYQVIGQVRSLVYFMYYPTHCLLERGWDVVIGYLQFRLGETGQISPTALNYDGGSELKWNDLGVGN